VPIGCDKLPVASAVVQNRYAVAYTVDQRGLGKAMKHSPLWFATPLAWTLVLLGATVFAIFA